MEKEQSDDLDNFLKDAPNDVKIDLDDDSPVNLDGLLSDDDIEYISPDPADDEDVAHSYTDDDAVFNDEDLHLDKATDFNDFNMNSLDMALKSFQEARRGRVFSAKKEDNKADKKAVVADNKVENVAPKDEDVQLDDLAEIDNKPFKFEDDLPEVKGDLPIIEKEQDEDFPVNRDVQTEGEPVVEEKPVDDFSVIEDEQVEEEPVVREEQKENVEDEPVTENDTSVSFDDLPEVEEEIVAENEKLPQAEENVSEDVQETSEMPQAEEFDYDTLQSSDADLESPARKNNKPKMRPMVIRDSNNPLGSEDEQKDVLKWYSGKIDDKSYEVSLDNMPEFLDTDKIIRVIHINVNSTYGWNVFFDNGIFMNLQDLKTYQTRNGRLPYSDGKIVYGNKTCQFENIKRIVVYETPRYFSYKAFS